MGRQSCTGCIIIIVPDVHALEAVLHHRHDGREREASPVRHHAQEKLDAAHAITTTATMHAGQSRQQNMALRIHRGSRPDSQEHEPALPVDGDLGAVEGAIIHVVVGGVAAEVPPSGIPLPPVGSVLPRKPTPGSANEQRIFFSRAVCWLLPLHH